MISRLISAYLGIQGLAVERWRIRYRVQWCGRERSNSRRPWWSSPPGGRYPTDPSPDPHKGCAARSASDVRRRSSWGCCHQRQGCDRVEKRGECSNDQRALCCCWMQEQRFAMSTTCLSRLLYSEAIWCCHCLHCHSPSFSPIHSPSAPLTPQSQNYMSLGKKSQVKIRR